jgi:hypothetical protein
MKSAFLYITLIVFSALSFWVAFTWNIPTDNQIAMAFMGCATLAFTFLLVGYEISEFVKNRKKQQQAF